MCLLIYIFITELLEGLTVIAEVQTLLKQSPALIFFFFFMKRKGRRIGLM